MSTSGPLDAQPGSHRNSLNVGHFSPQELQYEHQGFPSNYDPRFEEVAPDQQPPTLVSQHEEHHPQHQFSDYPLYSSAPDDYGYDLPVTSGASINPAELMSHHRTPSLGINQDSHGQTGGEYLSGSSTRPSANGGLDWETVYAHNQQQNNWQGHRRAASVYSDISSAAPSPYLGNQEFCEPPSPLLQGQHYPDQGSMSDLLNSVPGDSFGMESFSIDDQPSPRISPSTGYHSEANSPYINAQETNHQGYVPPINMGLGLEGTGMHQMMPPPPPPASHGGGIGLGLGISRDDIAPRIDISFAPPQRQPTFPRNPDDDSALCPPPKSPGRRRSKSDPYANGSGPPLSRPVSQPGSRAPSPIRGHHRHKSLSPSDAITAPVGSPNSNSSSKMSRRSSTNSLPNRDYILELAHPNRPGATAGSDKRVQKHPATFQCTLCPKRFTRAYNLRSHLRTHTDERPFVCTVCGKAFARQHDRKRHEGLHSGEKKFVCRGNLKAGGHWGCGRRFARADALGRHFRSEAGRVCIRPLLDEETAERQRQQMGQQHYDMGHVPAQMAPAMDPSMGIPFPSALLEQYPALATMTWGATDAADYDEGEGGFDVSGNEFDDDRSDVSGISSHRNSYDGGRAGWATGDEGWVSDNGDNYINAQQG